MWNKERILVTGGASFIGSHLVDTLLKKGSFVRVADDFSSGALKNLEYPLKQSGTSFWSYNNLEIHRGDLKDRDFTRSVVQDIDTIFHLAALHGGRGYIHTHPAQCCSNMILDQLVFEEAQRKGTNRVCFASSACVYPAYLQEETGSSYLLKEDDANPFSRDKAFADLEYGWAKLMGEMALKAYHRQYGMKTSAVRIFTAYGPRENETHAIMALIAKALIKMDPFVIWGTGDQDRNFTYVQDIVDVLILASMKIEDGTPVNSGRPDRLTINQACQLIFKIIGWHPKKIKRDMTKPQGVASRAADITRAIKILGWKPKVSYEEGFQNTINWYRNHKDINYVQKNLDRLLLER
ncbi:MAG: NAD-dependent epimerase/dehydratase family protein [Candidatus Bathyarchaeota archaeon]|nr:MAG: NAD-dependent epimerase/dehydratase family protein [Candidatus Bathyarchaeota archaeon]